MKKMYKIATSLLAFCFLVGMVPMHVKAEEYRYQVTIYSGNQGDFSGTAGLSVTGSDYSISNTADAIVIKDLNPGDTVSFEPRAGAVAMDSDSKYYIQGIRVSGRDNDSAVLESSFKVDEDVEYVVAYGIKGNQVAYTINYQDANGNKLADSQTFYGNVGDKPVVAYAYVDGYTPEYRNLTKTLSANAAENVFTFTYLPNETVTVITPGQTTTNVTEQTVTVPGATGGTVGSTTGGTAGGTTGGTAGGTTGGTAGGTTGGTTAGGTTAGGGTTANGDAQNTDNGNGGPGNADNAGQNAQGTDDGTDDTTNIEDQQTPLADQDLKDLDDQDVPKSNTSLDNKEVKKSLPLVAGVGIGVVALAALAAGIVIVRKRVHR